MISRIFTDRKGGISKAPYESFNLATHVGDMDSDVASNRAKLVKSAVPLMFMNQVHGDTVAFVDGYSPHIATADALVATESGVGLAVLVADCIPLLLWDEVANVVAVAHVGRRGLVNQVALKTIHVMRELGADQISAEMGPSICGKCYEVGKEIFREVIKRIPSAQSLDSQFEFALDLPQGLEQQLREVGVVTTRSPICTRESQSHFSFRRDGVTGRFAGVIWS